MSIKKGNEVKQKVFKLPVVDVNNFLSILDIVLIGDDRLKSLQRNFIEMIKRNDEDNSEQPIK